MSLTVPLYGFGSGGAGLNFDVKDYRTEGELQAAGGKENRIGVITSIPMTGWRFDANQPEDLQEGEVWISTSPFSPIKFNALKKNGVQVYPISAKQYVNGALENVDAKIFQNGEWWGFFAYIVKNGIIYRHGFSKRLRADVDVISVSQQGGYLLVENTSVNGNTAGLTTDEKVDLTEVKTIVIDIDAINAGTAAKNAAFKGISLLVLNKSGVSSADAQYSAVVSYKITAETGRQTLTLDVSSLSGSYYIGLGLGYVSNDGPGNSAKVYDLYYQY